MTGYQMVKENANISVFKLATEKIQPCHPVENLENLYVYIFVYHLITSYRILTIKPKNKMSDIQLSNSKGIK